MAQEIIGRCQRCGKPLTWLADAGAVSVDDTGKTNPGWVTYESHCPGTTDKHLLRLNLGVPGYLADRIGRWAAEAHEAELRKRNRAIADAHQRELAEHRGHQAVMGEWHEGTCTGCGTEDMLIGLPGSDLCKWCEELRVIKPPEDAAVHQVTPAPPTVREPRPRMLASSVALACIAMLLIFANAPVPLCAGLLALSFVLGKAA